MNAWLLPGRNRTATWMLVDLLKTRMEAVGVRVADRACAYDFNKSVFVFQVSDAVAGLTVIREVLTNLLLLPYARIAWQDAEAGVTQYYPKHGKFPMPSAAELEDLTKGNEYLKGFAERLKSGGTNPPNA